MRRNAALLATTASLMALAGLLTAPQALATRPLVLLTEGKVRPDGSHLGYSVELITTGVKCFYLGHDGVLTANAVPAVAIGFTQNDNFEGCDEGGGADGRLSSAKLTGAGRFSATASPALRFFSGGCAWSVSKLTGAFTTPLELSAAPLTGVASAKRVPPSGTSCAKKPTVDYRVFFFGEHPGGVAGEGDEQLVAEAP